MREREYVWLEEERKYAILVNRGAFFSLVRYSDGTTDFEVYIENDDIEFLGDDDEF
jgi:hypothetical protein